MIVKKQLSFMQGIMFGLLATLILITFNVYSFSNYKSAWRLAKALEGNVTDYWRDYSIQLQDDKHVHNDDDSVAKKLSEQVRVLVAVMTSPNNLKKRAQAVKDTWGKRCSKIIYFSTEENKEFPTIRLDVPEGFNHLTAKTMTGFNYIYKHFFNDFDWFMKADDDTYVIMENLRYFLADLNSSEPVYFGHRFKRLVKQGYHGGGAGYVLSKESLRRFGENTNRSLCREDGGAEDVEMGRCLERLGVRIINSTDSLGRSRFHSLTPDIHLFGTFPKWYYWYDAHGATKGRDTISDYVISFHKITPSNMTLLDFFVYHLRPYGIVNGDQMLNNIGARNTT